MSKSPRPTAKKTAAPAAHRAPKNFGPASLMRIFAIHQRLCDGRRVIASVLAEAVGCSERTIGRDVAAMRTGLGAPIEWDPSSKTFYYTRTCDLLPIVRLETAEAVALSFAALAYGAADGAPLGDKVVSGLEKLRPLIGGAVSFPFEELRRAMSVPQSTTPEELRRIQHLVHAILERRELRLTYRKPGARATELRTVHPLHLIPIDRLWVLIVHDPLRDAIRHYVLRRIEAVAHTGQGFTPPPDFDLATHLADLLGRYHGGGKKRYEVRVALDATAAFYINETPWQKKQDMTDLPDGRFLLTVRTNNLVDIRDKVLVCGDRAEVLEPAELRAELHAIHTRAAARYAPATAVASTAGTSPQAGA